MFGGSFTVSWGQSSGDLQWSLAEPLPVCGLCQGFEVSKISGGPEELLAFLLPPSVKTTDKLRNFKTHFCGHSFPASAFYWGVPPSCSSANEGLVTCFSLECGRFRSFKDFWGFLQTE